VRIIALDLALTTGWCELIDENVEASGIWDFRPEREAAGGHNGSMFNALYEKLGTLIDEYDDTPLVIWERAHMRGGPATRLGMGWIAATQMVADTFRCPIMDVHTGTLKKFATGDNKAGKDAMIAYAETKLGRPPVDDNEADAVCCAYYGLDRYVLS
jgi:hypothetical protein